MIRGTTVVECGLRIRPSEDLVGKDRKALSSTNNAKLAIYSGVSHCRKQFWLNWREGHRTNGFIVKGNWSTQNSKLWNMADLNLCIQVSGHVATVPGRMDAVDVRVNVGVGITNNPSTSAFGFLFLNFSKAFTILSLIPLRPILI